MHVEGCIELHAKSTNRFESAGCRAIEAAITALSWSVVSRQWLAPSPVSSFSAAVKPGEYR